MAVIHFNEAGFDQALAQNVPILVDFWAVWCGPCKMVAPAVDALADEYEGRVAVGKVNVDEEPALAQRYGVMSIPTLVLIKDGQEVARQVGALPLASLKQWLDANL